MVEERERAVAEEPAGALIPPERQLPEPDERARVFVG